MNDYELAVEKGERQKKKNDTMKIIAHHLIRSQEPCNYTPTIKPDGKYVDAIEITYRLIIEHNSQQAYEQFIRTPLPQFFSLRKPQ